jgi:multidrug resistance efflux pump
MRSLEADGFRASVLGLLFAMLLLVLWIAWLFLGRVTCYEVSYSARLVGNSKLTADFPLTALAHVRPGQPARLYLNGFPWTRYGTIPTTVTSVSSRIHDGQAQVELAISPDSVPPIPLQHGLTGTVEIEIERVSPATLVLRAAGQLAASRGSPDSRDSPGAEQ